MRYNLGYRVSPLFLLNMKIAFWNVNGIRACAEKGLSEYLRSEKPDIIGLQEVKAQENENPLQMDLMGL